VQVRDGRDLEFAPAPDDREGLQPADRGVEVEQLARDSEPRPAQRRLNRDRQLRGGHQLLVGPVRGLGTAGNVVDPRAGEVMGVAGNGTGGQAVDRPEFAFGAGDVAHLQCRVQREQPDRTGELIGVQLDKFRRAPESGERLRPTAILRVGHRAPEHRLRIVAHRLRRQEGARFGRPVHPHRRDAGQDQGLPPAGEERVLVPG
jgi:hypothetical protein